MKRIWSGRRGGHSAGCGSLTLTTSRPRPRSRRPRYDRRAGGRVGRVGDAAPLPRACLDQDRVAGVGQLHAPTGSIATRYSSDLISLGTPTIIRSISVAAGETGRSSSAANPRLRPEPFDQTHPRISRQRRPPGKQQPSWTIGLMPATQRAVFTCPGRKATRSLRGSRNGSRRRDGPDGGECTGIGVLAGGRPGSMHQWGPSPSSHLSSRAGFLGLAARSHVELDRDIAKRQSLAKHVEQIALISRVEQLRAVDEQHDGGRRNADLGGVIDARRPGSHAMTGG